MAKEKQKYRVAERAEEKLTEQTSVKTDRALHLRLIAAAVKERHERGKLARFLLEWALEKYEEAGSLDVLLKGSAISGKQVRRRDSAVAATRKTRVSQEAHEELLDALRIILERAPATVIEDVAAYLTKRAGMYGQR